MTERWEHDPRSPWLSQGHAEALARVEPEVVPEPTRSQAERLNAESLQRIRAAICRRSTPTAGEEAARSIRRAAGSRMHGRVLQPVRDTEGAA